MTGDTGSMALAHDIGATVVGEAVAVASGLLPPGWGGSVVLLALLAGRILTAGLRAYSAHRLAEAAEAVDDEAADEPTLVTQVRAAVRSELASARSMHKDG